MDTIKRAFTLLELLVVITIIVVLLALLTPAMDKAIYIAELAADGAQIKTASSGFTQYAFDHRRHYIHRPGLAEGDSWDLELLSPGRGALVAQNIANTGQIAATDLRGPLRSYFALNKNLQDPFVEPVDIDGANPNDFIYQSYLLFAGWRYTAPQGGGGMNKLGDRIAWNGRQYSVLVADVDKFSLTKPNASSSHQDSLGLMTNIVWEHQDATLGQQGIGVSSEVAGTDITRSWYVTVGSTDPVRGTLDRNIGYADLSVKQYLEVQMPTNTNELDERMEVVPWQPDGGAGFDGDYPTAGVQLPRQ